ncbi:MAG: hypothetical protein Fur002_01440 [Anaerolineales bacterium]
MRRTYLFLFLLGLAVPALIARYQPAPGYLDSDYYFAGGVQLATGEGFSEPYLWNYLDGVQTLPHPSHSYWMPLASIIAALGMWLTGQTTYAAGRLFFLLIAACVPPLTAALAYQFSRRRDLALTSGILAVFCVFNAPFVGVTDNFGIFMLLGVLYFLVLTRLMKNPQQNINWLALGVLAALFNLSRSDGLLWLGISLLLAVALQPSTFKPSWLLIPLAGFLLVLSPWYLRNWNLYGTLMAPGGSRVLWLTEYDQTFTYPPNLLTLQSFLAQGWRVIFAQRAAAFGINLQSGFAAHGGIVLFPFIIAGILYTWKDQRVKTAALAWLILLFVMSFLFPFAGARGAFFHAGAALQPMWWVLAPLGLESILVSLRKRGIGNDNNRLIFRAMLVMVTMMLTVYVVNFRLFALGWGEGEDAYPAVETFLVEHGAQPDDIVVIGNPPGYWLETRRAAVAVPYGGASAIRVVAEQFHAKYLILEPRNRPPQKYQQFKFLGETHDAHIYQLQP